MCKMDNVMDISSEDGGSINMSNITLDNTWTTQNENGQNILYITVCYFA